VDGVLGDSEADYIFFGATLDLEEAHEGAGEFEPLVAKLFGGIHRGEVLVVGKSESKPSCMSLDFCGRKNYLAEDSGCERKDVAVAEEQSMWVPIDDSCALGARFTIFAG
jgi:hypothetical protein